MMLDQGYGDGDLSLRLHQLKFYLRAVVNAILDHKMHCAGHDRRGGAEAARRARLPVGGRGGRQDRRGRSRAARSSRRTSSAGRRSTGCGRTCSAKQGDAFDLGKFHEAVLSHGTLPVKYLPELVK